MSKKEMMKKAEQIAREKHCSFTRALFALVLCEGKKKREKKEITK